MTIRGALRKAGITTIGAGAGAGIGYASGFLVKIGYAAKAASNEVWANSGIPGVAQVNGFYEWVNHSMYSLPWPEVGLGVGAGIGGLVAYLASD